MSDWQPIQDLPNNWQTLGSEMLAMLSQLWIEQMEKLHNTKAFEHFLTKMKRRIAIETGVIERLYTIPRGITEVLVEQGIYEALIPHGATDRPASQVVALVRDQEEALEGLYKFVSGQRQLTTSYIKDLHQAITRHQDVVEGRDQFGNRVTFQLLKGDWKTQPNNPTRPDGTIYSYCPPLQVAPQMEQLMEWHHEHKNANVPPEVEAAWMHHRFTQIHPFQDGNGRVARLLASLVFIRARLFPLVITREDSTYIDSLEAADQGDLEPLIDLFTSAQQQAIVNALSLSEEALSEARSVDAVIKSVIEKVKAQETVRAKEIREAVEQRVTRLHSHTLQRFAAVQEELTSGIAGAVTGLRVYTTSALPEDGDASNHFRYQIVQTARKLDYFANLTEFKSWVNLAIEMPNLHTEILISFHYVGHEIRGLMACSVCAYRKVPSGDDGVSLAQELEPLSVAPFYISYLDEPAGLQHRFNRWLEERIILGLEYWRRGV